MSAPFRPVGSINTKLERRSHAPLTYVSPSGEGRLSLSPYRPHSVGLVTDTVPRWWQNLEFPFFAVQVLS